ncbi:MAG: quinolinate synthase NadA [bacterium]
MELDSIIKLKKEKNFTVLAHNYQLGEVQEIADFVGDSLELSRIAREVKTEKILFAGVRFMAETAKLLSPEKKVVFPVMDAGCEMADMVSANLLKKMKSEHPNAAVVAYVNTTAEIKSLSDICCTSSNAVKIVNSLENEEIIFIPDKNLAAFVQRQTKKRIFPYNGWCYVHNQIKIKDVLRARDLHPGAKLMIHPEAPEEVQLLADYVLSTGGMQKTAGEDNANEFIVGTERGMVYRLKKLYPHKIFHLLREEMPLTCYNMKKTRLNDVKRALTDEENEIVIDDAVKEKALSAIERMLQIK